MIDEEIRFQVHVDAQALKIMAVNLEDKLKVGQSVNVGDVIHLFTSISRLAECSRSILEDTDGGLHSQDSEKPAQAGGAKQFNNGSGWKEIKDED